jgi:hypothetical protein
LLTLFRCFAHIVNLTAKAMLSQPALMPNGGDNSYEVVKKLRDVISEVSLHFFYFLYHVKLILYKIRFSDQRHGRFSKILENLDINPLQLICDVETQWSSVYLMITRALALRQVSSKYNLTFRAKLKLGD